jgi:hypothetical protein
MPINNLSEEVRMPRLGKFHLGIKDTEKGYPIKTDYIVLPKDHPDYNKLVAVYGLKPKELNVLIPSENLEDWAPQYYKMYDLTHGLICKGDGIAAMRLVDSGTKAVPSKDTKTTTMIDLECKGNECPFYKEKKCGEVMNLRFVLPDIPGLGVWQIDTGSINSILNINSCAKLIKLAFGRITNIPLKLTLEPSSVNNPENGKKQTVYILNLRSDVTLKELAEAARMQTKNFMLEAPDMAAAFEELVEKDIKELWPDNNPDGNAAKATEKQELPAQQQTPVRTSTKGVTPAKEGDVQKVTGREPASIKTSTQLYKACCEDWPTEFKSSTDVLKELGVNSWTDVSETPETCYRQIAETRKGG